MELSKRRIQKLFERIFHGALKDQQPVAREHLPHVLLERDEANRRASEVSRNWHERNEEWGGAPKGDPPSVETPGKASDSGASEPFQRSEDTRHCKMLRTLGVAATSLELPAAGYAGQFWLNTPSIAIAALVGLFVSFIFTIIAKSVWGIGPQDHSNPKPESKRRERLLWGLGLVITALLASIAVTRFFGLPDWAYILQLTVLSALLPIFAAGAFVLADLYGERNRLALDYWSFRAYVNRLEILIARMKEVLGVLALGSLLFLNSATLQAETIGLWLDVSGSPNQSISALAYNDLSKVVVEAGGVERIEVFGFAGGLDSLRMPSSSIDLPKVHNAAACQVRREIGLFTRAKERHQDECKREREQAERAREGERASLAVRLSGILDKLGQTPESKNTCFFQVLLRCISQGKGRLCVVVTDGEQYNCPMPSKPPAIANAPVIVILVPKKGDDARAQERLEKRSLAIRQFAPRVAVIPLYEMQSDLPGLLKGFAK